MPANRENGWHIFWSGVLQYSGWPANHRVDCPPDRRQHIAGSDSINRIGEFVDLERDQSVFDRD